MCWMTWRAMYGRRYLQRLQTRGQRGLRGHHPPRVVTQLNVLLPQRPGRYCSSRLRMPLASQDAG